MAVSGRVGLLRADILVNESSQIREIRPAIPPFFVFNQLMLRTQLPQALG